MSSYLQRLKYKKVNCNSDSDSSEQDEQNTEVQEDIKPNIKKPEKTAARGKLASLISNLDNSDESDSEDDNNYLTKNKSRGAGGGIYAKRLNQTKQEKKVINHKFHEVDKNIVNETDETESSQISKTNDSSNSDSDRTEKTQMDSDDDDSNSESTKKKRLEKEATPEPEIELPPPPITFTKSKRKSTSLIDKQFKELESFRNKTERKKLIDDSADTINSDSDVNEEILNNVTVRVSTKSGLKKWDINENQQFRYIFEKLAQIEKTGVENLVLMIKDRIIGFNDTPASINLKAYDILDCGKTSTVNQEKVKVVEEGEQIELGPNMITVNLQTDAGRKSRVKFLISMDEKFEWVLKKYCEKKGLEFDKYSLQMEGDKIDLKETPRDLDFEDDFMIDVTRSTKAVLQQINENKKNYEFDDDILLA
ncbi:unnamed protein product [Brachionus calyciflorus]|uniref:Rad60/SUMO-like domain-containing protein n=1 Tax=Brachionus calyciflorus TaxID=104777 RepID=A0A813XE04_9BILA|nr:unnamed protein product [Brachionus calyciflorus]